jgi:hypothetical protein
VIRKKKAEYRRSGIEVDMKESASLLKQGKSDGSWWAEYA